MKNSILKISRSLLYFYLLIFPLGQLLKIPFKISEHHYYFNLCDLLILLFIPLFSFSRVRSIRAFREIWVFIAIVAFSFSLSFALNGFMFVETGLLYLVRLISYVCFSAVTFQLIDKKYMRKENILEYLLGITLITAILGWVQYLSIPDLRFLKNFNWDDHLYRLAGTFLDPAFTGLIILFGVTISVLKYLEKKRFWDLAFSIYMVVTLFFTYGRATVLALVAVLIFIFQRKKLISYGLILKMTSLIVLSFVLLPRYSSEGTYLTRTQSIYAKFANYGQTLTIIKKSPLFGVGFDNLCSVRTEIFGGNAASHACSGADSSLLFIMATSGIVGFLVFLSSCWGLRDYVSNDKYGFLLKACGLGVLVHSLFVQSMFYSFTLGFIGILFALSIKSDPSEETKE